MTDQHLYNLCDMIDFAAKLTRLVHRSEPHDVDICRPGKWGNPFVIGVHGTRKEVCRKHLGWLLTQPDLVHDIHREIKGKVLGCACHSHERFCHGNTLVRACHMHPADLEILIETAREAVRDDWFWEIFPELSKKDLTNKRNPFITAEPGPARAEPQTTLHMNYKQLLGLIALIASAIATACNKAIGGTTDEPETERPISTRTVVEGKGGKAKGKAADPEPEGDELTIVEEDEEPAVDEKKLRKEIKAAIDGLFAKDEDNMEKVSAILKKHGVGKIAEAPPAKLPAILASIQKLDI